MSDLHERIAKTLGWSVKDARSLSMQALRELVRPVDPSLTRELDYLIQSGAYIRGEPPHGKQPRKRDHAEVKADRPKKIAKDIEAAVRAAQLYIGKGLTMRVTDEQKLYNSMNRKIASVAKRRGMDEAVAYQQITAEAKRRGGIQAIPGKDI